MLKVICIIGILIASISNVSYSQEVVFTPEKLDEYGMAVYQYYEYLSRGQYREAYDMRSQCKVVLTSVDGSGVSFLPRQAYDAWLARHKNIISLKVIDINRITWEDLIADKGNAEALLGIRTYKINYYMEYREETPVDKTGTTSMFAAVVRGNDGKIRILGIGSGP